MAGAILGLAVVAPNVTDARRSELVVTCPGVQSADGYDQDPVLPKIPAVQGDTVDYQTAGAEVTFEVQGEGTPDANLLVTVTYQGVRRVLTTAGNDLGTNYPNRSPGPGDTAYGFVAITTGTNTWLTLARSDSGLGTLFAWRLDGTCGDEPAPAPTPSPGQAAPAEAVDGTATFTG